MKKLFTPILAVLAVLTISLAVTSTAFAQDTAEKTAKGEVELRNPALTFYYIDR